MSYIVFARKYRPQLFDEIIGQPHITTTLANALSQDRVAHAYLFAGPRGVGKTTAARILAKALNCEKGPTPKPCNSCISCKEIIEGRSLDILEIDGASNRGIDEIRNLRENVKFAPTKGKFKVYIIDEVHMLTAEAFNALLKTLEEPPPHVKFIFATTQAHKVPATILSRCQRFDFRRISSKDIAENLRKIRKAESLDIDDDAIELIAKYSDGGMRNGQVVLDQITSFTKGKVRAEDLTRVLGIIDEDVLFGFSAAFKKKDPAGALRLVDNLVNDGKDVAQVVLELIEHFRNISVAKISGAKEPLIDAGAEKIARYSKEAEAFTIEEILYIIYTLSNTIDFIRKSTLSRIPFEAAVIKLTRSGSIMPLEEILKRLEEPHSAAPRREAPSLDKDSGRGPEQSRRTPPENTAQPENEAPPENDARDKSFASWNSVIEYISNKRMSVASFLRYGCPLRIEGNRMVIGFPKNDKFHKEALETPDNKRLIEEGVKAVMDSDFKVIFELVEPADIKRPDGTDYTEKDPYGTGAGESGAGADAKKDVDPIVKTALEMFGGSIAGKGEAK